MQPPVTPDLPACNRILARTGRVEDGPDGLRVSLAERRPAPWLAAFGVVFLAPALCWTAAGRDTLRTLFDDARARPAALRVHLSRSALQFARTRGEHVLWEDALPRASLLGLAFAPAPERGAVPPREGPHLRVHARGRSLHVPVPGGEATGPALLSVLATASARMDGAPGSPARIAACPRCATRYAFAPEARCPACGTPPVPLDGLLDDAPAAPSPKV